MIGEDFILYYIFIIFLVLWVGASIGSFLNVVALRAISNESIVFPSSKCPKCNEPIKWYDNIPIFSYLFTFKGKCRSCGEKVSIQYPIVEALTAILFLAVFLTFGISIETLLILIMLSISIVIAITDIKESCIYSAHYWILIIAAIATGLYTKGLNNYHEVAIGLIVGVFAMEAVARLSYFLIKKENSETEEKTEFNEYIKENKRAFGEGDTYLTAAAGALLGWQYGLVAIALAIILQAICVLPQFIFNLYKQKEYRLLVSLSGFVVLALIYWTLKNVVTLPLAVILTFIVALIFFAIDTISRLKKTVVEQGFVAIPFGPAILCAMFLIFFFAPQIIAFLQQHIFMVVK